MIIITAITQFLTKFQISELAHRVGHQLSAGIINAKFGRELRKLEQINIVNDQGTTLVLIPHLLCLTQFYQPIH